MAPERQWRAHVTREEWDGEPEEPVSTRQRVLEVAFAVALAILAVAQCLGSRLTP